MQIIRNPESDPWRVSPSWDAPFHYVTHPKNLGKAYNEKIYIFVILSALHFINKSWDRFEYGNSKGRIQTIQENLKNSH